MRTYYVVCICCPVGRPHLYYNYIKVYSVFLKGSTSVSCCAGCLLFMWAQIVPKLIDNY